MAKKKKTPMRNGISDVLKGFLRFSTDNVIGIEYHPDSEDITITATNDFTGVTKQLDTNMNGGGGGGGCSYADFSAGNIKALIFHGTEYIETDYLGAMYVIFSARVMPTEVTSNEHYFGCANGNNRTDVQRNGGSQNTNNSVCASSTNFGFYSIPTNEERTLLVSGYQVNTSMVATLPLTIGAGYYQGHLEAQRSKMNFYGLNIMDIDGNCIARYMPWLENETPCVKDLISGNIFYNSGTGTFGYIENDGTVHQ